ncbi:unnamed protein product [Ceratitis capitata]|uniref:(Mediterranean fruit fly) hypothetical protein n=1 Tax=Ceratitis capitata TaxID=7213 RepID=A0A811UQT3_CERCA|nr:unnamed protein product [Ceratitis capitata]
MSLLNDLDAAVRSLILSVRTLSNISVTDENVEQMKKVAVKNDSCPCTFSREIGRLEIFLFLDVSNIGITPPATPIKNEWKSSHKSD